MFRKSVFLLLALVLCSGPVLAEDLQLSFADPAWDGKAVPQGQWCKSFGGVGSTPSIRVEGIPPQADALIFKYGDKTFTKMSNGGHGILGFRIPPGTTAVTVPSASGQTFDLPEGFYSIRAHRGTQWGHGAGAYLPPCSGGKGNYYDVKVLAVKLTSEDGKDWDELADGKLKLGRY
ncbi:MAG: hypothetical protein V3573_09485 [Desulfovibrionaceae bacterium]